MTYTFLLIQTSENRNGYL